MNRRNFLSPALSAPERDHEVMRHLLEMCVIEMYQLCDDLGCDLDSTFNIIRLCQSIGIDPPRPDR